MDYLRSAPFGGLFAVTFVVSATCQAVAALLGFVLAALSPGLFQMNGAPAQGFLPAAGVVLFLLILGLAANSAISAAGSALWLLVRRLLPRPTAA